MRSKSSPPRARSVTRYTVLRDQLQVISQPLLRAPLTVVHRLKVIHKRKDILMSHGNPLQHGNLVPHHMLPPRHKPLIDDLRRIISSRVDVHAFLHYAIRAGSQRLPGLVATGLDLRLWLLSRSHCWLPNRCFGPNALFSLFQNVRISERRTSSLAILNETVRPW